MIVRDFRSYDVMAAPIQKLFSEVKLPNNLISLGQGVPFFQPPMEVVETFSSFARRKEGYLYSGDFGYEEVRLGMTKKCMRENKYRPHPENIMMTSGGNQAFMNALLSITNVGDSVVVVAPYYFNHVMAIQLAGCIPVVVEVDAQSGYIPSVEQIQEKINDNTKAVVTVSPNNPSGAVYPQDVIRQINELCAQEGIFHISDEVYEYFLFEGATHVSPACFDKELDHTISLYSFSKAFSMSGYRIGFMVFPESLSQEVLKIQDTIGICAAGPSQWAALKAVGLGREYVEQFLPVMEESRTVFFEELSKIEEVSYARTKGGYYVFVQIETNKDIRFLVKELIEKYKVMVLPGDIFGVKCPSLRLSYGNVEAKSAVEGMKRLRRGLSELL